MAQPCDVPRRLSPLLQLMGLASAALLQAGCVSRAPASHTASPTASPTPWVSASVPAAPTLLLPESQAHAPAWFDDRLDRRRVVVAGPPIRRTETVQTFVRRGTRVGFDGRVRDTLRIRARSESSLSTTR